MKYIWLLLLLVAACVFGAKYMAPPNAELHGKLHKLHAVTMSHVRSLNAKVAYQERKRGDPRPLTRKPKLSYPELKKQADELEQDLLKAKAGPQAKKACAELQATLAVMGRMYRYLNKRKTKSYNRAASKLNKRVEKFTAAVNKL